MINESEPLFKVNITPNNEVFKDVGTYGQGKFKELLNLYNTSSKESKNKPSDFIQLNIGAPQTYSRDNLHNLRFSNVQSKSINYSEGRIMQNKKRTAKTSKKLEPLHS